jgi:localization factor PodJL
MAYGYARGPRRGYDPDPRDIVEDAARAAGMSVEQWLDRAAQDWDDGEPARPRRANRSRRRAESSHRDEAHSDDRMTRILDDALESIQQTVRANEERTAAAIASLGRRLGDSPSEPAQANQVRGMVSDLERRVGRFMQTGAPERYQAAEAPQADSSIVRALEEKIANVVGLIEQREMATAAPEPARAKDLRQGAVERQIGDLGRRLDVLTRHVADRAADSASALVGPIHKLQQEIARLGGVSQRAFANDDVIAAIGALDAKIGRLERAPQKSGGLDRVLAEVAALRAGLQSAPAPSPDRDAVFEQSFAAMGDRLDDLSERIAKLRMNGPRDLRQNRALDTAISELREMIQSAAATQDDGRVLRTLDGIERKLDVLQRAPAEITERLDRFRSIETKLDQLARTPREITERLDQIQSIDAKLDDLRRAPDELTARLDRVRAIEEKLDAISNTPIDDSEHFGRFDTLERKLDALRGTPMEISERLDRIHSQLAENARPQPLPASFENMLRNLAVRLESMQAGPVDERAFDRLHADIRDLSRKMEALPAAQHSQAADISGLERAVTSMLGQIENLKAGFGSAAELAARRAASDVLSHAPTVASSDSLGDAILVQQTLTDIHTAQQEAERRTSETLGAVHDTLKRVVDRLVDMEQDMKRRDEFPAHAPAPQPATFQAAPSPAPFEPPPSAPVFEPAPAPLPQAYAPPAPPAPQPFTLQEAVAEVAAAPQRPFVANPLPPLGAPEPNLPPAPKRDDATASLVASMRAQRLGVSSPQPAEPKEAKSAIVGALAAARSAVSGFKLGKGKAVVEPPQPAPIESPPPLETSAAFQTPPAQASLDDLPLEPGSGRPRPGAPVVSQPDPRDPKAHFLAAARRAAQVAADQSAEVLDNAPGKAKAAGKKTAGKTGFGKKHALLLGLAALIVAVGTTLKFTSDVPPETKPAPPARTSVAPLKEAPAAPPATEAPKPQASIVAPRQILPPAEALPPALTAAKPDSRVMTQPPRAAQPGAAFMPPDPSTVGSIAAEPPKASAPAAPLPKAPAPSTSTDPLMRFEGVTGSERLKEAARIGDPAAFIELGARYLEGRGAPRDPKAAALWFERAADFGSAPAQYRLGALYREGRGLERNAQMAMKHFQVAAEAGNARAMHNTAVLLAEGVNGSPDYAAAAEWFKKSAEFGVRDSQFNLAILYARGLGVSQDLMASYAWFAAAAGSGDEDAGKKRDEVGARLSPEKLQQAKTAAAAWKPKTPDPAANEVLAPPGGWDAAQAKQVPDAAKPGAPRPAPQQKRI